MERFSGDPRVLHQLLIYTRDAEVAPVVAKQGRAHWCNSCELFPSLSRELKNVTRADRNRRQSTEINEALERTGYFFDDEHH